MNKYKVSYMGDFFITIEETEITCLESDIKRLADEYYENNKEKMAGVIGATWRIID